MQRQHTRGPGEADPVGEFMEQGRPHVVGDALPVGRHNRALERLDTLHHEGAPCVREAWLEHLKHRVTGKALSLCQGVTLQSELKIWARRRLGLVSRPRAPSAGQAGPDDHIIAGQAVGALTQAGEEICGIAVRGDQ